MASSSEPVFGLGFEGTAIQYEDGRAVSYAELKELSDKASEGLEPHTVKVLLGKNDIETMVRLVGYVNHGIVPLLLPATIDGDMLRQLSGAYEGVPAHEDLALLLSTSGSTGSPKLVRIAARNIAGNSRICVDAMPMTPDVRMMMVLPAIYAFGLSTAFTCLSAGATLIMSERSVMDRELHRLMVATKATHFVGVPYMYEMLDRLRFFTNAMPDLRCLLVSGGAMAPVLRRKYAEWGREKGITIREGYGQTETAGFMSFISTDSEMEKIGSIGRVVDGCRFRIEDEELVYEGPNTAMGYALSAADLLKPDDWGGVRHTGDLARIDGDGYVFITGRASRFLKVYGCRVSLEDVERLVKDAFEGIDCAATGADNQLKVFVTDPGKVQAVQQLLVAKMHFNAGAFTVKAIDALPRSAAGKVQYAQLMS